MLKRFKAWVIRQVWYATRLILIFLAVFGAVMYGYRGDGDAFAFIPQDWSLPFDFTKKDKVKEVIAAVPEKIERPKKNLCLEALHEHVDECSALEVVARSIMQHESGMNPMAIHFDRCEWRNDKGKCRLNEKRDFESVEHLAKLVESYQFAGILKDNFGTGCMQVNVDYHADKLCKDKDCVNNLKDAFDVDNNIKAGLTVLRNCFAKNKDFKTQLACYNTMNPENQPRYLKRVMPIYEKNQAACIKKQFAMAIE
jgi:hypothetical protein